LIIFIAKIFPVDFNFTLKTFPKVPEPSVCKISKDEKLIPLVRELSSVSFTSSSNSIIVKYFFKMYYFD